MHWDELFSRSIDYDPCAAERPGPAGPSPAPSPGGGAAGGEPATAERTGAGTAGSLSSLPTGGGVYLLTDEQDRFIQLASAADLKRAILNRLAPPGAGDPTAESAEAIADATAKPDDVAVAEEQQESSRESCPSIDTAEPQDKSADEARRTGPPPSRRADLSQIVRRIRWQPAHSAFEITFQYLRIARAVLPDTYLKNVAFGPAWFVHVDPAAVIPRFTVSKLVQPRPGTTLGPFATQSDANKFVQILEDAFDLCRYIHILEQAPHGQPCAYHEMGRCPAPCGGLIPMSQYRETMQDALQFAAGDRQSIRQAWELEMREAASGLAFERAAAIKQRIDRAKGLDHTAYRFVRPVEEFSWLIVQRGGGRTRVKPFFVRGGILQAGEPVPLKQLEPAVPQWLRAVREPFEPGTSLNSLQETSEYIWLVSHFLFRRERSGLFLDAVSLPEPDRLAQTIREHFAAPQASAAGDSPGCPVQP